MSSVLEQQQQSVATPTTAARSPTFLGRVLLLLVFLSGSSYLARL